MAKGSDGAGDLAKQEQRLAYILLLPTFVILLVIAIYPLGSVFVNSFTNNIFASAQPVDFVGAENYANLLSMTVKQLPVKIDEDTGQAVIDAETGKAEYESPVRILPREPRRFKPVTTINLFGSSYVLGATDPDFIRSVWDTIAFAVATVFLELVLGIIVALIIDVNFPGPGAYACNYSHSLGDSNCGLITDVGVHAAARSDRILQHFVVASGAGQRRDPFLDRPRSPTAVHDCHRCLEDNTVHGAADLGRSAVDPKGYL